MVEPVVGMPLLRPDIHHDLPSMLQELDRILEKLPELLASRAPERQAYSTARFFKAYYEPTLKRLALEAPFEELRERCAGFLEAAGCVRYI